MSEVLHSIFGRTEIGFVLVALTVSTIMAVVVVQLLRGCDRGALTRRPAWMLLLMLVAGLGVWATHFIAMLGFRPDMALGYDPSLTAASAVIGIVFVGVPLAASVVLPERWWPVLGLAAGAGVGLMHFGGMAALEGCETSHAPLTRVAAFAFGMVAFAIGLRLVRQRPIAAATNFVAGVCLLHFTAMAGLTLTAVGEASLTVMNPVVLSAIISMVVVLLCGSTFIVSITSARLEDQRQSATAAMEAQYRILSTALESMSNGLLKVDRERNIVLFNNRMLELLMLGDSRPPLGMPVEAFLRSVAARVGWDQARTDIVVGDHMKWYDDPRPVRDDYHFADGRVLSIACRPTPDGGAILTFDDVSEKHNARAAMEHMAGHDTLTGLPNRLSFNEELRRLIATQCETALITINLDRFHAVNDVFGHAVGDAALRLAAQRVRECCRSSDLVFRLGGDEIAVLPQPYAPGIGETLARRILSAFDKVFLVESHSIRLGCSIGLALSTGSDADDQLLQRAALALHRAQALGGRRMETYMDGMVEQAVARRQIESDLAQAIATGQFELVYQPLFGLPGGDLRGFEALIRWNHPTRGRVSPADFIPLSEENGMILQIGAWTLDEACRQLSRWPEALHVAVNVSSVEMQADGLVERVMMTLDRYEVDPRRLELELTETAMVEDRARISETLARLRNHGVRIAMDDFGTGYSSLQHLRDFEIDRIKIDRRFVDTASDDLGSLAVTRAVIGLARDLSIETTAEGVETAEQLARLVSLGCDNAQGYFLGRPLPEPAATALVNDQDLRRAG